MLPRARANVARAGLTSDVSVEEADILALPYATASFDRVVAEAVTMFVDRAQAAAELVRVCAPGVRVLGTEFCWRRPPRPQAREIFLGQVCPGLQFDTVEEWTALYEKAGLTQVRVATGPFDMMTLRGFLADEGTHALRVFAAALTPARLRKMAWLMPRMMRAPCRTWAMWSSPAPSPLAACRSRPLRGRSDRVDPDVDRRWLAAQSLFVKAH